MMRLFVTALVVPFLIVACQLNPPQKPEPSVATSRPTIPPGITGLPSIAAYPWNPDLANGQYKNPVLFADYSDPDVCRVGDDYYLTASSFSCLPGLPILHSKDMVNWKLIGHAITHYPVDVFKDPQHGGGVWAPAIRHHNGEFYIYYGDPDHGIFMTKAKNPAGPWEPLHLVLKTRGWIDTCPFWDEDGKAYLVHAFANSRAGISNLLHIVGLSPDGRSIIDDGQVVFDARGKYTTLEGPKFYKRNGYYYIFAPGGGVAAGYQIVFRSKNIYGPYESQIVLDTGKTKINGPHQGAWVNTPNGREDWFIHFQEVLPYGRLVHLQPMQWQNDWPVIGEDPEHDGKGQPVLTYKKPDVGATYPAVVPNTSDEFSAPALGLQWQWWSDYKAAWMSLDQRIGFLRLNAVVPEKPTILYERANLLLQKFPAETFTVTAKIEASSLASGQRAGLVLAGKTTVALQIERSGEGLAIVRSNFTVAGANPPSTNRGGAGRGRGRGGAGGRQPASQPASQPAGRSGRGPRRFDEPPYVPIPRITTQPATRPASQPASQPASRPARPPRDVEGTPAQISSTTLFLRMTCAPKGLCTFFYSTDGTTFTPLGDPIIAINDSWIGAKVGLFSNAPPASPGTAAPAGATAPGHIDVDWFRFE